MKRIISATVILLSLPELIFASESLGNLNKRDVTPIEKAGGLIPVPDSQKGHVSIVNRQNKLPHSEVLKACEIISDQLKIKVMPDSADNAGVVIEIVSNTASPSLVVHPEDGYAQVNVARMKKGLTGKGIDKFFASRCRKEILRAFSYASGAVGSQYTGNIMDIFEISDLDYVGEFIPGDTAENCRKLLAKRGVYPKRYVTYRAACIRGWAPSPTNEIQKAIMKKVYRLKERGPTNPIRIPMPKKK